MTEQTITPGTVVAYTHSPFDPIGTVERTDDDFAYVRENTLDPWGQPINTRPALLLRLRLDSIRPVR